MASVTRKLQTLRTESGVVLFYPGRLLTDQINGWAMRSGRCRTSISFDRTIIGIRDRLRRAAFAVIDATEDPSQGADAFLQSVNILGSDSVALYSEKSPEGLELLVRTLGSPLLLGPMSTDEWDGFLEHKFPTIIPFESLPISALTIKPETSRDAFDNKLINIFFYKHKAS
jgi:hypothetical protein